MALATAPMHSRQVQALQQCDTARAFWVVPTGLTALEDMNPDEQAKPKADRRTTPGEPYAGKPPVRFDEGRCSPNDTNNCGWFNSFTPSPTLLSAFYRRLPNAKALGYSQASLKDEVEILLTLDKGGRAPFSNRRCLAATFLSFLWTPSVQQRVNKFAR